MDSQLNRRSAWSGGGQSARLGIEFGHAKAEGSRSHPIEDYHVATVKPFGHGDRIGLFAIFDGHGGMEVAEYLKENLFEAILDHPKFSTDPQLAIRESYMAIDQRILDMGETSRAWRAGSTATTAFLMDKGRRLIVANVGDSRAVLSRGGFAVDLSVDHEPQKPQERHMVTKKKKTKLQLAKINSTLASCMWPYEDSRTVLGPPYDPFANRRTTFAFQFRDQGLLFGILVRLDRICIFACSFGYARVT